MKGQTFSLSNVASDDEDGNRECRVSLKWIDLTYIVPDKFSEESAKTKVVLDNVRGSVCSGQVIGILGPSGSGKTSLLNCISQRVTRGLTGKILLNEKPLPANFSRNMGYVSQDELFLTALTVSETLSYSAQLKLKSPRAEIRAIVDRTLAEMDLEKVGKSLVGEIGNGISGGERRRLAIGTEIIDQPLILLLDEPTSGLDSASALMVARVLKKMATKLDVAVICTIHQPRVTVLKLFDKISLMGSGKILYYGDTVPKCLEYFSQGGFECPTFENPADWMLDLVNTSELPGITSVYVKTTGHDDVDISAVNDRQIVVEKLAAQFLNSFYYEDCLGQKNETDISISGVETGYRTSICNQLWVLTKRNFMYKLREPMAVGTQVFNDTAMPLVIGGIYWHLGLVQTSIGDRMSFLSLAVLMQAFAAFDVILLFPKERELYLREQKAGLYRTSAYILAKTFSEHPVHAICAAIGAPIYYYMAGLQNDTGKFFIFTLILIMATLTGASMLSAIGALSKTMEQSNLVATIFIILFMLLDGTWVSLTRFPKWVSKLSFMGLSVQAAIYNEFSGIENFVCDPDDDAVCFHTGEEVLDFYGYDEVSIWTNLLILFVQFWVWKVITYFAVRFLYTGIPFKKRLRM